jgi:hypothetical protein
VRAVRSGCAHGRLRPHSAVIGSGGKWGRLRRFGATALAVGAVGLGLAACRTPIAQAACDGKLVSTTSGALQDPALVEVSGLAVSAKNADTLWAHNDSGDTARLFAITPAGATRAIYTLTGATAIDWEDMAIGPGPTAGTPYLYAGDIGDNAQSRTDVAVYRVPEPTVAGSGTQALGGVEKLTLRYPDGAHDAEALFVDPRSGELYVIQKSIGGGAVGIYRAAANLAADSTTTLTRVGTLSLPTGFANAVTAADITPDGDTIAVRSYGGVRLYSRTTLTVPDALAGGPCAGPLPAEGQGETVAFQPDGRAYSTVSEGASAELHRFSMP